MIQRSRMDARATAAIIGLCLLWGANQVAVKIGNSGVAPIFGAGLRSAIAAVCLALWGLARGVRLLRRDGTIAHGMVIGALFGSEFLLLFVGLDFTTASHAVVFLYVAPFLVALGAHLLLPAEPLTLPKSVGLLLAFGGLLATFSDSLGLPTRSQLMGDALVLMGGVLWAATSLYIKAVIRDRMTPPQMLFYQLAFSAVLLAICSAALERPAIRGLAVPVLVSFGYQGIVVSFASYLVWFWLIQVYPVSAISAFTFITPIVGVFAGGILLGEPLTRNLMAGAALVAAGMVLVNRPVRRRPGRVLGEVVIRPAAPPSRSEE